jgi:hypothetical protein
LPTTCTTTEATFDAKSTSLTLWCAIPATKKRRNPIRGAASPA